MSIVKFALLLHVASGCVALLSFWLPWVSAKGGAVHRRSGWIYVGGMVGVAITATFICIARLLDSNPGNDTSALFLFAVGILSAGNASLGVRSLRTKRRTGPNHNPWDLGIACAMVLSGLGLGALGLRMGQPLFLAFAALSALGGAFQLRFWLRPPRSRMAYWYQHIGGMGGSCIATLTAFLVTNARLMGLSTWNLVVWAVPSIGGGIAIALWIRHYRRKFEGPRAMPPRPLAQPTRS